MHKHILLGTAGHIDHGKTALIQALTGINTDRLPEEKRRGITVELGFASLEFDDLVIGIVDVPGHEDLIKNMLAGATGIDLALLVIAADEGVMPQTREHFHVLRLLGLSAGVIALTKFDLVDEGWSAMVKEDIADLVKGSFLEDAPLIEVSAKTEYGLAKLRDTLHETCSEVPERRGGPFRLAIDRVFSATGHGTVVTGSVASGTAAIGDELELMPRGIAVKVRGLESHSRSLDTIGRGERAAINLASVHYRDIQRGEVLASVGSLRASQLISVCFETPTREELKIRSPLGVRFHIGSAEVVGNLRLLSTRASAGLHQCFAQIKLREPVAVVWGQPFILRELSANRLLGGGTVVDPLAYRIRNNDLLRISLVEQLASAIEQERLCAAIALAGQRDWDLQLQWLRTRVTSDTKHCEQLVLEGKLKSFQCGNRCRLIDTAFASSLKDRLLEKLLAEHRQTPLKRFVPLGRIRLAFTNLEPPELLEAFVAELAEEKKIVCRIEELALSSWQGELSARQCNVSAAMITDCLAAGLTPPSVGDFSKRLKLPESEIEALLQFAADSQLLSRLPDKDPRDSNAARTARLYLHPETERQLILQIFEMWTIDDEWTVSEFNEALGLSRKYAVPLCQHLDQRGVTMRIGDRRRLVSIQLDST